MICAVLDTNILVSALWSHDGNPAKVIHLIPDGKIVPCYCEEILREYNAVLSRPRLSFSQHQIDELINNIRKYGKAVIPKKSAVPFTDESDRFFYDTALAGQAILITGNAKHYPTEPFIMTPVEFLTKLI
ncbi:MAG: putative toxin-antitoxin system toxin component, PIN family [Defluviitaleaceae bacterium]|nr:putative toxin-antitoxin system toxin component, PIN family [Defluviitaleaceae bacterium]